MRFPRIWFIALLALAGCFSGTEVGNPEVSLRVALISAPGWEMLSFPVKVLGSTIRVDGKDTVLWDRPGGYSLDAADSNSNSIPAQAVPSLTWDTASIELGFPTSSRMPSDTTDWSMFRDSGWVAFRYTYTGGEDNFLFALPDSLRISLAFDAPTLAASKHGDSQAMSVWLDCRVWVAAMPTESLVFRPGGKDGPFAVLSPTENTGTYLQLLNALPNSFRTLPP